MNLYAGLLFNQGHLSDPDLVRSLAGADAPAAPAGGDAPRQDEASRDDTPACTRRRRGWVALCCTTALSAFR